MKNSLFSSEDPIDSSILQEEPEEKNCKVIEKLSENVFWELVRGEDSYVTIFCKRTNIDKNKTMPNSWKGLFPKVLFKSQAFHEKGFEFGIKTKTEKLNSESYNTAFSGNSLENSLVVGEWDRQTTSSDGKEFITVNILGRLGETDPVYLLFPDKVTS